MLRITRPDYGIPFRVQVDWDRVATWGRRSVPAARPELVPSVPSLTDRAEPVH